MENRLLVPNWNAWKGDEVVDYGKMLKAFREFAGYTQQELADKLNRSRSCISKFEGNRKVIDLDTFRQWVQVTNSEAQAAMILFGTDVFNTVTPVAMLVLALILNDLCGLVM